MRRIYSFLFLFFPILVQAQQSVNLVIEGTVSNARTHQGIPFASVRIQNKPIGITANEEGAFRFIFSTQYQHDTLEISSVGFKSQSVPVASVGKKLPATFLLEEAVVSLNEVKVVALSPLEILQQAIRHMDKHFDNNPYQLESFFRIAVRKDKDFIGLLDAAIQLQDKGFKQQNSMSADLIQLRKIVDKPNWLPGSGWTFRSPAISFEDEFARVANGILNLRKAKKFWDIQLENPIYQDNDLIYVLNATAIRFAVYYPYYNARLHIRARDYAILQIDYDYGNNINAYAQAFPATNPFGGTMSDQTELRYTNKKGNITFSEYEDKLYLSREFFQETGRVTNKATRQDITYEGSFEIFVNQVRRGPLPAARQPINQWDDIFTLADRYDSTYWANYNKPIHTSLFQSAKANLEKKESLEEQFKKYTAGLSTKAEFEKRLLTESKQTEHFLLSYHPSDAGAILEMAQKLEENYQRVVSDLQVTDQPQVRVKVYPDLSSYHQGIGNPDAPAWEVGSAQGPDEFTIVSPNKPGSAYTYQDILNASVHEFTHCVHAQLLTHYPDSRSMAEIRWLSESIACYEAKQFRDPAQLKYLQKGHFPSIAELNTDAKQGFLYQLGYVLIEYIKQRWGMKTVVKLLQSDGDIEPVLGMSQSQFEKDWHAFIKATYFTGKDKN